MKYCPDCGLEDHPHQTCKEANMTDEEIASAMRTEWGIRSLVDGTHRGPMAETEAREWVARFPNAYILVCRQYSDWCLFPKTDTDGATSSPEANKASERGEG